MKIEWNKVTWYSKLLAVILFVLVFFIGFKSGEQAMKVNSNGEPAQSTINQPINTVSYACNSGKTIIASYYAGESKPAPSPDLPPTPGGSVKLKLSDGRSLNLAQTISADGIRYANADESFIFWGKGNGALVLENNKEKSFIGCILVAPEPAGGNLSQIYSNSSQGFSLRYSPGSIIDEKYSYSLNPGKDINGVKFTIPASVSAETNLSTDSYLSVESIYKASECSASLFLSNGGVAKTVTDNGTTYSLASASDAAAGNRYEETVYAIPGTNPCLAIRYFIHYGVFENYPPGTIKQFDKQALLNQFDAIRRTLTIAQ